MPFMNYNNSRIRNKRWRPPVQGRDIDALSNQQISDAAARVTMPDDPTQFVPNMAQVFPTEGYGPSGSAVSAPPILGGPMQQGQAPNLQPALDQLNTSMGQLPPPVTQQQAQMGVTNEQLPPAPQLAQDPYALQQTGNDFLGDKMPTSDEEPQETVTEMAGRMQWEAKLKTIRDTPIEKMGTMPTEDYKIWERDKQATSGDIEDALQDIRRAKMIRQRYDLEEKAKFRKLLLEDAGIDAPKQDYSTVTQLEQPGSYAGDIRNKGMFRTDARSARIGALLAQKEDKQRWLTDFNERRRADMQPPPNLFGGLSGVPQVDAAMINAKSRIEQQMLQNQQGNVGAMPYDYSLMTPEQRSKAIQQKHFGEKTGVRPDASVRIARYQNLLETTDPSPENAAFYQEEIDSAVAELTAARKRRTTKTLTPLMARKYLDMAGGDEEEAAQLALKDGYAE